MGCVISVAICKSQEEIVSDIPRSVTITTNVPALIFYTLDGSKPNLNSTQYTGPIFLPTNQLVVILSVLATNGTEYSHILTEVYQTNMVDGNLRFSRNDTNAPPGFNLQGLFPYGDNPIQDENTFGNPANVGVTVDNPAKPAHPTGFDGQGHPTGFTNHPYNLTNYNIKYYTQNVEGESGPGIGNLPAEVIAPKQDLPPSIGPEQTDQYRSSFNPKAFVIFQDLSKEKPGDPPQINRMSYTLENLERARDGDYYYANGLDAPPVFGSFIRSEYNPRTGNITFYYYDNTTCRWIISTQPFTPGPNTVTNLSTQHVLPGVAGRVFPWIMYKRQTIF
jgi:hypothetical protein